MTNDLIDRLVADLKHLPPHAMQRLFLRYALAGLIASAAIMLIGLGYRQDLPFAVTTAAFWIKIGYAAGLLVLLVPALFALSSPIRASMPWRSLAVVVALIAGMGLLQWSGASPEYRRELLLGGTALFCPWLIVLLSMPVLGLLLAAMRRLAPASPMLAGLAAGILSGSSGALVYAFHCSEDGIPFVAIWYTSGIVIAGLLGLIGGRLFLKW